MRFYGKAPPRSRISLTYKFSIGDVTEYIILPITQSRLLIGYTVEPDPDITEICQNAGIYYVTAYSKYGLTEVGKSGDLQITVVPEEMIPVVPEVPENIVDLNNRIVIRHPEYPTHPPAVGYSRGYRDQYNLATGQIAYLCVVLIGGDLVAVYSIVPEPDGTHRVEFGSQTGLPLEAYLDDKLIATIPASVTVFGLT